MATYTVKLINEAEGINAVIEVADDQFIYDAAEEQHRVSNWSSKQKIKINYV